MITDKNVLELLKLTLKSKNKNDCKWSCLYLSI